MSISKHNFSQRSLSKRLADLRKENGLSVIDLAKMLNISRHSVYKWETEVSTPSTQHLQKLSEIFNTDLEFILYGEDSATLNQQESELDNYIEKLENAVTFSSMTKVIIEFMKYLDLDKFLYNQIFRGDTSRKPKVTILTDIGVEWQTKYAEKYSFIDPTWNYATTHTAPILCDDFIKEVAGTNQQVLDFYSDMRKSIAPYFVVIPIHGPCCLGAFVVSAKDNSKKSQKTLHNSISALTVFGHHIYEATHRVAEKKAISHSTSLTQKELSIINYLANGLTIKEIAEKNFITVAAVNARISSAKVKMGANNREQLVLLAASANLLPHSFGRMIRINT